MPIRSSGGSGMCSGLMRESCPRITRTVIISWPMMGFSLRYQRLLLSFYTHDRRMNFPINGSILVRLKNNHRIKLKKKKESYLMSLCAIWRWI